MKRFLLIAFLSASLALAGCATQANTTNPSTYDLLFRQESLQAHLAERRAVLDALTARLDQMDRQVEAERRTLSEAQYELIKLSGKLADAAAETQKLTREIGAQLDLGQKTRKQLAALRTERTRLMTVNADAEQAGGHEQLRALQDEISRLEKQVAALKAANGRLMETHEALLARAV